MDLPQLLNAADRLERDEASEDELRTLLRGGSSLGGARPKAPVLDDKGGSAIAKFPSTATDEWDVMRWEAVALRLARAAGIRVPDATLHLIDGKAVLIVDRFDRAGDLRVGYVSAMTMLEANDGDHGTIWTSPTSSNATRLRPATICDSCGGASPSPSSSPTPTTTYASRVPTRQQRRLDVVAGLRPQSGSEARTQAPEHRHRL